MRRTSTLSYLAVASLALVSASPLTHAHTSDDGDDGSHHQHSQINSQCLEKNEDGKNLYGFTFSGQLAGYGKVGGDSTFNYKDENYGGGFNLGTTDDKDVSTNGLGGGYSINKTSMSVGAGISAFGQKVNFHIEIKSSGEAVVHFDTTHTQLACVPSNNGGQSSVVCTSSGVSPDDKSKETSTAAFPSSTSESKGTDTVASPPGTTGSLQDKKPDGTTKGTDDNKTAGVDTINPPATKETDDKKTAEANTNSPPTTEVADDKKTAEINTGGPPATNGTGQP